MPEFIKNWLYKKNPFNYKGGLFGPRPEGVVYGFDTTKRKGYNQRKALQQMYLGVYDEKIPVNDFVIESKYYPTTSQEKNTKYYTFTGLNNPETKLQEFALYGGGVRGHRDVNGNVLKNYSHMTISKGRDGSGDYYGLYDTWDFDSYKPIQKINQTFNTDIEKKLGFNPIELYDRVYLDDYYNIPEDKRGGNYLDELVVTPNKSKFVNPLTKQKSGGKLNYLNFFK